MPKTHTQVSKTKGAARPQGRLSKKARQAIDLIATQGITQREAAKRVGLHEVSLSRALSKPPGSTELIAAKNRYLDQVDDLHAFYKKRAIEVAGELMENANSEAIRMRAVEFFAGESQQKQGSSVTVNVGSAGYGYLPPDAKVIDVTPDDDQDA